MGLVIDTNVITKILVGDSALVDKLWVLNEKFHFLIPDPVDSEVHVFCSLTKNVNKSVNAFQNLVDQLDCELVPCTRQIWELTASYYAKYLKNRDIEKIQCSKCGFQAVYLCTQCSSKLTTRQHLLTDFIIGAFAEIDPEKTLLTLDQGVFKTYFPELNLI